MDEIIARIEKEIENAKSQYVAEIGKIVIAHIKACPNDGENITSNKTLAGCFDFLRDRARKNQKNGCGVTSNSDVFDYFGFAGDIMANEEPKAKKTQAPAKVRKAQVKITDLFD